MFDFPAMNKVVKLLSIAEVVENPDKSGGERQFRPFWLGITIVKVGRKVLKVLSFCDNVRVT